MSISYADVFDLVAGEVAPESPAIVCDGDTTNWAEFQHRSDALACALLKFGLQPDAKVALYMRNGPDYLIAFAACFKARLVSVNINYRYGPDEVDYLLQNGDAEAVIFDAEFAETLNATRSAKDLKARIVTRGVCADALEIADLYAQPAGPLPEGRSGDDIFLLYTGGTTGLPKGVMWPSQSVWEALASARLATDSVEPVMTLDGLRQLIRSDTPAPRYYIAPPLMHGTGLFSAISVLSRGGAVVCSASKSFDPVATLGAMETHSCDGLVIVGDAFARPILSALDAEPERYRVDHVEAIVSSGMMWSPEVKQGLLRHMPKAILSDGLGASEASSIAFSVTTRDSTADAASFALVDTILVDPDTLTSIPPDSEQTGVIAKAGALPLGYYKDPERTARTYVEIEGVRRMISGDHANYRADGTILLLGRGSHCINTAGEKVYPEEVEEALKTHPAVTDALVFGRAHERFGQSVAAVVSARKPIEEDDLIQHVKSKIAGYKAPREIRIVDTVPRAPNGKADYASAKILFEKSRN